MKQIFEINNEPKNNYGSLCNQKLGVYSENIRKILLRAEDESFEDARRTHGDTQGARTPLRRLWPHPVYNRYMLPGPDQYTVRSTSDNRCVSHVNFQIISLIFVKLMASIGQSPIIATSLMPSSFGKLDLRIGNHPPPIASKYNSKLLSSGTQKSICQIFARKPLLLNQKHREVKKSTYFEAFFSFK